jgi:hypothetical protein
LARRYVHLGFKIVATEGTANVLESAGLIVERVFKVKEGRPNVVDLIKGDRIQLIINTPRGQDTFFDEKAIRRAAVLARIPTITTIAAAQAAAEGIAAMQRITPRFTPCSMQAGASGAILAFAACAPQACQEIYLAWKDHDLELAGEKQQRIAEANQRIVGVLGIAGVKYACDFNGYYGGRVRSPLLALTAEEKAGIETLLSQTRN